MRYFIFAIFHVVSFITIFHVCLAFIRLLPRDGATYAVTPLHIPRYPLHSSYATFLHCSRYAIASFHYCRLFRYRHFSFTSC